MKKKSWVWKIWWKLVLTNNQIKIDPIRIMHNLYAIFLETKNFDLIIKIKTLENQQNFKVPNLTKKQMLKINFGRKSKFWSKIEILVKNRNFGQKSKFWSKIILSVTNRNFRQKLDFQSIIKILVKNRNFGLKFDFLSTIGILVKNQNLGQTSESWSKIGFDKKSKFRSKL